MFSFLTLYFSQDLPTESTLWPPLGTSNSQNSMISLQVSWSWCNMPCVIPRTVNMMDFTPVILYGTADLNICRWFGWVQPNHISPLEAKIFLWLVTEIKNWKKNEAWEEFNLSGIFLCWDGKGHMAKTWEQPQEVEDELQLTTSKDTEILFQLEETELCQQCEWA